jgi:hypothetical protein
MTGTAMQIIQWLSKQKDGQVWEIKRRSQMRSLTANAYYWVLVGKMADALRIPKPEVHNKMLRAYGQVQGIDGRLVTVTIPDTEKAEKEILMAETYHLKPTSQVKLGTKDQMFRTYVLLKGSHELTSEEFTVLLDGTVREAEQAGVETLTPMELEALKYAEHHKNK